MKITIPIELEFDVLFVPQKGFPMTRHYPGDPDTIEIYDIYFADQPVTLKMFNAIIEEHEDDIIQCCWDEVKETEIDMAISRMEDR